MQQAVSEIFLAIFTTLAPIGAGAFIALALAFCTTRFTEAQLVKIDALAFIPLILVVLGFVASTFHLASPLNATMVFSGVGTSLLSNEILVGAIFFVIALAYCVLAITGKLSYRARKVFIVIVALAAVVFALFTGMAYMMRTISSWDTVYSPLEVLGFSLLGGALLGSYLLVLANVFDDAKEGAFKRSILALTILGALISIVALVAHLIFVGSLTSSMVAGATLAREALVFFVLFVIGAIVALVCEWWLIYKKSSVLLAGVGTLLMVLAVFSARLMFYAIQLSVGL